jgi:DNA-binding NarL/FixJ family response regulator
MNRKEIKIYIVDDHPVVRRGLSQFINSREGFSVCGEASDANTAIAEINEKNPDIVIVDINLKGASGIDLIKAIKGRHRGMNVLVLSMHEENEYVERAMRAGARGYLLKNDSEELLLEAVTSIMNNKFYLSSSIRDKMIESMLWHSSGGKDSSVALLTDREFEIFELIGRGHNTREIAEALSLSASTVGTYRERIKTKLNIFSPNELMKYAVEWVMNRKE